MIPLTTKLKLELLKVIISKNENASDLSTDFKGILALIPGGAGVSIGRTDKTFELKFALAG